MNVAQIIDQARDRTWITASELSDTKAVRELNFAYYKIWQEIALIDRNYWIDERTENLTWWVNRYPLLLPGSSTHWQIFVDQLLLKYKTTDTYHKQAQEIDWNNISFDQLLLENLGSEQQPYYIITDNELVIFPKPKVSIWWWLRLRAYKRPYDLTIFSVETDILLEREYHDILTFYLVVSLYRQAKQIDLVQFSQAEYDRKKIEMMRNIKRRSTRPMMGIQTDLSRYTRWS